MDLGLASTDPTATRRSRMVAPLVVLSIGLTLTALTWNRWVELLVDFGRELYVPWRITQGDVLYRDIAYFSGPLSPHVNALWFWLFGPGVRNVLILNFLVLAAFTWLAYRILRRFVSPAPAVTSCAAFLVLCAFALYATYSSFDLIAPYSHEVSHGLLIAAVGLVLVRGLAEQKVGRAVGVGVCVGLALLTKPEIALAVGVSLTAGVCLTVSESGWTWKRRLAVLALLCHRVGSAGGRIRGWIRGAGNRLASRRHHRAVAGGRQPGRP